MDEKQQKPLLELAVSRMISDGASPRDVLLMAEAVGLPGIDFSRPSVRPGEPLFHQMAGAVAKGRHADGAGLMLRLASLSSSDPWTLRGPSGTVWEALVSSVPKEPGSSSPFPDPVVLSLALSKASRDDLLSWGAGEGKDTPGTPLLRLLLSQSGKSALGPEPADVLLGKGIPICGYDACFISDIGHFLKYAAAGGDPARKTAQSDGNPLPLWEHLASRAERFRDTEASGLFRAWAVDHDTDASHKIALDKYFSGLDSYSGGASALKSRADWPQLVDSCGRTPMMRLVMSRCFNLKAFWDVKKALPGCAKSDNDGKNLWFYVLSSGKGAPPGTARWLCRNVPAVPDNRGNGLLSQVFLHLAGRDILPDGSYMKSSERMSGFFGGAHEMLLTGSAMALCAKSFPDPGVWFSGGDEDSETWAVHLVNKCLRLRDMSRGGSPPRGVESLAELALSLDRDGFSQLNKAVLGAVAVTLIAYSTGKQSPERFALADHLLSLGAFVRLDEKNSEALRDLGAWHCDALARMSCNGEAAAVDSVVMAGDGGRRAPRV